MQIKAIKVFCDVVGQRSFSQAANENSMSQSGASQTVHHLEEELGVKLIDRSKRPFVLTAEGQEFYNGARELVEGYYALQERVRTLHQDVEGRVKVAAIYSVGLGYLPKLKARFQEEHPHANVVVQCEHPDKIYQLVEEDLVDLGLVSYAKPSRTIDVTPWRDEPMVIVCSATHPLAAAESASLADLNGTNFVCFDGGLPIRKEIDKALAKANARPQASMQFDNVDSIKQAVEINGSVTVLPRASVDREVAAGTLRAIRIDGENLRRPLGVLRRHGRPLGRTVEQFIEMLTKES